MDTKVPFAANPMNTPIIPTVPEIPVKRGRGRPPKAKVPLEVPNHTTTEVSEIIAPVKRGRGRPPGAKNKQTSVEVATAPKKRGRPPGAKNKATIEGTVIITEAPKRRGRPPGAKNKAPHTVEVKEKRPRGRPAKQHTEKPKGKRGRPPGSKNKQVLPSASVGSTPEAVVPEVKKRRGRPPKNTSQIAVIETPMPNKDSTPEEIALTAKRMAQLVTDKVDKIAKEIQVEEEPETRPSSDITSQGGLVNMELRYEQGGTEVEIMVEGHQKLTVERSMMGSLVLSDSFEQLDDDKLYRALVAFSNIVLKD